MLQTRWSRTADGTWCCPLCAAHGIRTETREPDSDEDHTAIDDGATEPLVGMLCEECQTATDDSASP